MAAAVAATGVAASKMEDVALAGEACNVDLPPAVGEMVVLGMVGGF